IMATRNPLFTNTLTPDKPILTLSTAPTPTPEILPIPEITDSLDTIARKLHALADAVKSHKSLAATTGFRIVAEDKARGLSLGGKQELLALELAELETCSRIDAVAMDAVRMCPVTERRLVRKIKGSRNVVLGREREVRKRVAGFRELADGSDSEPQL
ncbi:MAG: hypothetical protein Q9219_006963, partial [cf. Caloplaca sp. 3 TL-2023]